MLHCILNHEQFRKLTITTLVHGEDWATRVENEYSKRVNTALFKDLDYTGTIERLASHVDIVINAGTGFHPPSAVAMVKGLANWKTQTGKDVWMIHTSGVRNIGDQPITGVAYPDREWDDANSLAIYEFEKAEEAKQPYLQRMAELAVLDTAMATGVNAISIQPPGIYGTGEGLFQQSGLLVPLMIQYVLTNGFAFEIGDSIGVIEKVHISDLAQLYGLLLGKILTEDGKDLPTGRKGIVFAADNVHLSHHQNALNALDAAFEAGQIAKKEIRSLSLTQAAKTTAGLEDAAEAVCASHKLTRSTLAYRWGWRPKKDEDDFLASHEDEVRVVIEGKKKSDSIANAMAMD